MKNERRPLKSQLLQQNVFLRDSVPAYDLKKGNNQKEYYDVFEEDVIDKDGCPVHREVMKKVPYPHTPESVQSFESSTDYKIDPSNARRSCGVNLGDVSALQSLFRSDNALENSDYREFLQRLAAFSKKQTDSALAGKGNSDKNESGVKGNE